MKNRKQHAGRIMKSAMSRLLVLLLAGLTFVVPAGANSLIGMAYDNDGQPARRVVDEMPVINKPKHIAGAPASDRLEAKAPVFDNIEALEDWLITQRRATWQYFDKLAMEDKARILLRYRKYPDTDLLSEAILRTYWQVRRR